MRGFRRVATSLIVIAAVLTAASLLFSFYAAGSRSGWSAPVSAASFKRKGLWEPGRIPASMSTKGSGVKGPRALLRGVPASPPAGQQAEPAKLRGSATFLEAGRRTEFVEPKMRGLQGPSGELSSTATSPEAEWRLEFVQPKAVADRRRGLGELDNEATSLDITGMRKVAVIGDRNTTTSPALPSPSEDRFTRGLLRVIGCIITVIVYCNPIIVLWSTGNNMAATVAFCTMSDLLASATGTGAWLLFAVVQLHGEDGRVIGLEAVITNAVGLTLLAIFIAIKVAAHLNMGLLVCAGTLICFAIAIGLSVSFTLFWPIKRETLAAHDLSVVATVLQIVSQLIPFISAFQLWFPPAGVDAPIIMNERPLIVYSRCSSFAIYLYWAMYAVLTYQHSVFEKANVASSGLSFLSLCFHLGYALKPTEEAQAAEHND